MKICIECGMPVEPTEYHPYAACLMFLACKNSGVVRANLDAVIAHGVQWESDNQARIREVEDE